MMECSVRYVRTWCVSRSAMMEVSVVHSSSMKVMDSPCCTCTNFLRHFCAIFKNVSTAAHEHEETNKHEEKNNTTQYDYVNTSERES